MDRDLSGGRRSTDGHVNSLVTFTLAGPSDRRIDGSPEPRLSAYITHAVNFDLAYSVRCLKSRFRLFEAICMRAARFLVAIARMLQLLADQRGIDAFCFLHFFCCAAGRVLACRGAHCENIDHQTLSLL